MTRFSGSAIHILQTIPSFSSLNYPHTSNYPKIPQPQLSKFLKLPKYSPASTIHIPQIIQRFSSLNYPHSSNYPKILQPQLSTFLKLSKDSPASTIHSSNYPKILQPQLCTFLKQSQDSPASTIHIPQTIQRFSSLNLQKIINLMRPFKLCECLVIVQLV
jgi:hypothetical protein